MSKKATLALLMVFLLQCLFLTAALAQDPVETPPADPVKVPTSEEVMRQITGGNEFSISLDEFTVALINIAVKLINILQTLASPIAMVALIVGAITYVAGLVTANANLRRSGSGSMAGSILFLLIIKMAPIIVATIEGIVR